MEFLEAYVAKEALDAGLRAAGDALARFKSRITSPVDSVAEHLAHHVKGVQTWASEITFGDLKDAKQTQRTFVPLSCYVLPRHRRMSSREKLEKIPLEALFDSDVQHFVFLGTPGAGKTTSMKNLCNRILTDDSFAPTRVRYPLLVKLRELNRAGSKGRNALFDELAAVFGLEFEFTEGLKGQSAQAVRLRTQSLSDALCGILEATKALVILDGFDEIADFELRESVLSQVRQLALRLEVATIALTSRTGEFIASIDNAKVYEICPLGNKQISDFAQKWLRDEQMAKEFLAQVKRSPFADSAIKPLTLAHLCAVFERVGSIPDKPKTVYRKILHLLLEDWDEQRSVKRTSRYAAFESDRKYEFLANLAYQLTVGSDAVTFSSDNITAVYRQICADFGLPANQATSVTKEVESHTGLLLQCGFNEFEFAHKSLQEFLSAEFLVRLPNIPQDSATLLKLPNELAIATVISSNPSLYLVELVLRRFQVVLAPPQFCASFVTRLLQERPDFNAQENVMLALLALYSMTLEGHSAQDPQLQLFLYDSLIQEFEELVATILRTNSSLELGQFYEDAGPARVASKLPVHLFRRVKDLQDYSLPSELHVRESFLSGNPNAFRLGV